MGRSLRRSGVASGHDSHQRSEFLRARITLDDAKQWGRRSVERLGLLLVRWGCLDAHSGMFPCFFGGNTSRLVRNKRNALVTSARVVLGLITAST